MYRLPQASKRDRVYDPASFPPREETDIITYDPLDLPKEDLDEVCLSVSCSVLFPTVNCVLRTAAFFDDVGISFLAHAVSG